MALPRRSIRQQLLFEHEVLRALLGRLADLAERTRRGEPAVQELRDAARSLCAVLEVHVEQEERALARFFARHGPQRLQELRNDHRKALETLRRLRARPPENAAAGCRRLVPVLMAAIEREGRDILAADLWKPHAVRRTRGNGGGHPARSNP